MLLNKKEINVYGTGNNALKFWIQKHNSVSIKYFVEGKKKKVYEFIGTPVIPIDDAEAVLKSRYTVVACEPNVYWEIKGILEEKKLIEFEHFEFYDTFDKKIAIIWGNCHADAVKHYLQLSKDFTNKYGFYPVKPIQEMAKEGFSVKSYRGAIEKCDLFIHQCVRLNNYFGQEYSSNVFLELLNSGCMIIGIPNLYRLAWFMFPQTYVYDGKRIENEQYFDYDRFIEENYQTKKIPELVCMMQNENLVPSKDIQQKYEEFKQILLEKQKQWDIDITTYVIENLQSEKLFYDVGHPSEKIVFYIAKKVLDILGIDDIVFIPRYFNMDTYELPVYQCVKKALGLTFNDDYIRMGGSKISPIIMDKTEYIRQYIMWTHPDMNI